MNKKLSLEYIDFPTKIPESRYNKLIDKLSSIIIKEKSVLSIYQMGSVNNPGISDIDLICIFKNNSKCHKNFRDELNHNEKNILTHGIFGIEHCDLNSSFNYNLISNLRHISGECLNCKDLNINKNIDINKQIAMEYMIKMYITIDIQLKLKIIKVRAFLLLAKAIDFDLQLLEVNHGKLFNIVKNIISCRNEWFIKKTNLFKFEELVISFYSELKLFLKNKLNEDTFFLPTENIDIIKNIRIKKGEELQRFHKGIVLPNCFSFLGKKYINVQNRLNQFTYFLPFEISNDYPLHSERFSFIKKITSKNKLNYPYFIPLTTSLPVY